MPYFVLKHSENKKNLSHLGPIKFIYIIYIIMSVEPKLKKARLEVVAEAMKSEDTEWLHSLLEDSQEWLDCVDEHQDQGWNMLHLAAMNDNTACIEMLIKTFPNLAITPSGQTNVTPLLLAVEQEKELNTIKALLTGAGKEAINIACPPFMSSPLCKAYLAKRPGNYAYHLVKLLLDQGATFSKTSDLRGAIEGKNLDVVKLMIKRGCKAASFYENDYNMDFPLHTAAGVGSQPIIKLILKHAPSTIKAWNKQRETALFAACRTGHVGCVEELLAAGANPNHLDYNNISPLTIAASRGHAEVVKLMLQQKLVQAADTEMNTWREDHELHPIINAISSGSPEIVRMLVNSEFLRYDLYSDDQKVMCTQLEDEYCIEWGKLCCISYAINDLKLETEEIVNTLLDKRYPVNPVIPKPVPPLSVAVMQMAGKSEEVTLMMERIIRRLLEEGANLEFVTFNSYWNRERLASAPDSLVLAVQTKNIGAMHLLLQYWDHPPAELLVSYENHDGVSPLNLEVWFPVLIAYGKPHGSPSMVELDRKLQVNKEGINKKRDGLPRQRVAKKVIGNFIKQMRTPSSLKQLARFAVRELYGKEATNKKQTLPTVLKDIKKVPVPAVPAELMSYLLMEVQ